MAYVYDKAKYHFDACAELGLPVEQAYVHTGLFVAWLVEHSMVREEWLEDVARIRRREATPGAWFRDACDGVLADDMLTVDGRTFADAYFDFDVGPFIVDFRELLVGPNQSDHHVADTWESYDRIRARIDDRFAAFSALPRAKKLTDKAARPVVRATLDAKLTPHGFLHTDAYAPLGVIAFERDTPRLHVAWNTQVESKARRVLLRHAVRVRWRAWGELARDVAARFPELAKNEFVAHSTDPHPLRWTG